MQWLPRHPYEQPTTPQPISIDRLRKIASGTEWPEIGPRVTRGQGHLAELLDRADHLLELALSHGDTEVTLYEERFAWIRRGTRGKRNILGDGLRWLMGAATLDDMQVVKDDVASVAEQLQ